MSKKKETAGETATAGQTAKNTRTAGTAGYKTVEAHRAEIGINTTVGYLARVDMISSPDGNVKMFRVCGRRNNNYREDVVASEGLDRIRNIENDLFMSADEAFAQAFGMSAAGHLLGGVTHRKQPIHLPAVICGECFPQVIKVEVENRSSVLDVVTPEVKEVRHVC